MTRFVTFYRKPPAWGGLVVAMLWFFCHPYTGIEHDARIYTLMAIRWLDPQPFGKDPWFAYGSQDDWTIFSPIFGGVLNWLGVAPGVMLVSFFGGALLSLGAWRLSNAALRPFPALFAAMLLVSVPLCYSPAGIFYVMETFATSRPFAIALSMIGVAYALRGRLLPAYAAHLTAFLLHPIMALAPAATTFLWKLKLRSLLLAVGAGVLMLGLLLIAGVYGILPKIQSDWLSYIDQSPLIFVSPWIMRETSEHLLWLSLLLLGHRFGSSRMKKLYGVTALLTLASIFSTVSGEIYSPVVILMQAQLWRAVWFAQVIAICAAVDIISRYFLYSRTEPKLWGFLALASAFAAGQYCGYLLIFYYLTISFFCAKKDDLPLDKIIKYKNILWFALFVLSAFGIANFYASLRLSIVRLEMESEMMEFLSQIRWTGAYGFVACALLAVIALSKRSLGISLIVAALAVVLVFDWDWRGRGQRDLEAKFSIDGSRRLFKDKVPRGSVVYWPSETERVWLELGTSAYGGTTHTIGLIFSHERTRTMEARLERIAMRTFTEQEFIDASRKGRFLDSVVTQISGVEGDPDLIFKLSRYEGSGKTTEFGLKHLCRDESLNFVIDAAPIASLAIDVQSDQVAGKKITYYLYDCNKIRNFA